MNIQFYQKLTLLDFPQKTACTVFTYGCNLRCPFCHNAGLVTRPAEEKVDEEEFFKFLDKRKNLLDGVCITGGEPLLQPDIARFISDIKNRGFLVKLDTNGFFPDKLEEILSAGIVDYVAMDIKNSPDKYSKTCGIEKADMEKIFKSVNVIKNSSVDYEFRTTAVRGFHEINDFTAIGEWLAGNSKYYIQCFKDSGDTIEKGLSAFTEDELISFKNAVLPYLSSTEIRGI